MLPLGRGHHERDRVFRAEEGTLEARGQRAIPIVLGKIRDGRVVEHGKRVIHENVETAEGTAYPVHHRHDRSLVSVIGRIWDDQASCCRRRSGCGSGNVFRQVVGDDVRAFGDKPSGDRGSDTAARARDERCLVGETSRHCLAEYTKMEGSEADDCLAC